MWKELQKGWTPPSHITEDEYIFVRDNKDKYPDYYVGYVGYHATFGAKWFAGYARGFKADGITPRDHSNEAFRNTMKQLPNIMDVIFTNNNYKEININDAVIYCDPPYQSTTQYSSRNFDYNEFWEWCRQMSKNNIVLISEYNAPDDFTCIWQTNTLANFDCNRKKNQNNKARVEKLFIYNKAWVNNKN